MLEGEHLEATYSNPGTPYATYFRGSLIDEVVNGYQQDSTGNLVNTTYHHDALQSVLGQSGHAGTILATQRYGAFGNLLAQTGTSLNRLKYTGREEDADTGLYYYRARYYNPALGRFLSEDPLGFEAGDVNFYAYVGNNPVNANDPSGQIKLPSPSEALQALRSGGRLGNAATREHIIQVANEWRAKGWELISGGGGKEALIKNPVTGAKGGAYADIELYNPQTGQTLRINTIDTLANGITPTAREARNALKIQNLRPGDLFATVPKLRGGTLREGGSVFAAGLALGLGLIDALGQALSPVSTYIIGNEANPGADLVPSNFQGLRFGGSSAAGGFLLYPNKANTNMMQSVYSK